MEKFLVMKEKKEDLYHIYTAEGDKKGCDPTTENSLCERMTVKKSDNEAVLVQCQGKPATMASLSRTEESICPTCVSFL